MKINNIVIDGIEELRGLITGRNIMVEAPIGLSGVAIELSRVLKEEYGAREVIVSGRNAWGACDIAVPPVGFDLIHLGHALPPNVESLMRINGFKIRRGRITVISGRGFNAYLLPAYYEPIDNVVESLLAKLRGHEGSVILYPLLYRLYAESLARRLNSRVLGPFTGCFMPIRVNEAIVVSGGYFYALTAKLINPNSRILVADPHRVTVEDVEPIYRRYLSLKINSLLRAMEAKKIAVVLTSKPGQGNLNHALKVAAKLRAIGKETYIAYVDDVSPETINNINADAVIIEACPRIALDDLDRVNKPLIAPLEVDHIINGHLSDYKIAKVTMLPLGNENK